MNKENFFSDLSEYTYKIAPFVMSGIKNVGWLDLNQRFSTGEVSPKTLQKLRMLASGNDIFHSIVEPVREPTVCDICGEIELLGGKGELLRNSELWIPSCGVVYSSPITIIHFIERHNYLPPPEYIVAVDEADLSAAFDAEEIYRRKLVESGWFNRQR